MLTRPRVPMFCFFAIALLISCITVVNAQHEAGGGSKEIMGGGLGGSTTGRTTTRTTTKPPARTTTTRKPTTTTTKPPATTTRKPPVTSGPDASYYTNQGDQYYNAKNYQEALVSYQKAVDINPSLATAQYRIGWIKNDLEDFEGAIPPLLQAARVQPTAAT